MRGGRLISFSPQEISGYSTPVITEHLPTGSITYNANGALDINLKPSQTGGRYRRSKKSKKRTNKKRTNKKKRSIKRSKKSKKRIY